MPLISVLLPVYNCELYIQQAIESVLNQTFVDFELIIIDDCSTDSTLQLCNLFTDERIIIIEKDKNSGYTNSLNYGLYIAKGKYIARMDGDDICMPERFEKQAVFLEANPDIILCGASYAVIGEKGMYELPETHEEIKIKLLSGNCIVHPSVMFRKDILVANNLMYDILMEPAEDYDLWVRLSSMGKLHNLQECLVHYRVHDGQVSAIRNKKQIQVANQVRLKLLQLLGVAFSPYENGVYLKAIEKKEQLSFEEFEILVNLKIKLVDANLNKFFNSVGFIEYWSQIEDKFVGLLFKNRTAYNFTIFKQYVMIFSKLTCRLSFKETAKLFLKSLINYKVK
ncbi:glycosyltransferase family 2 protein [Flavobacterium sp. F-380]|uniref:Glycosyltransferase family 2 protein n=1 Tax=Flavobacterium kayseriense TaxID=2764714 RepID=A0ABR7J7C9_9FLAO|nr:glycosyltransferase family 2 protein [Flavobacterium kayseriense]MBC5841443.1 glycosyltransferase family 2 protein [Flavobacterium kayseriense]MBC5847971.1 glycosyltransferase family 2 protein [Flavobacterium kayseriense]